MIVNKINLSVFILFQSISLTANAKSIDYGLFEQIFGEPVTTSANGTPQRVSDVPLNMEIISQEDIRRSGSRNIVNILRKYSGVNVQQITETQTDIGFRGYAGSYNDRVLVLVNGRQVFLDYFGLVAWETLPVQLEEIRQIEVVKGPNTALFGFNAVSGVINILTYNPIYDDINSISLTAGSHDYREGSFVKTMRFSNEGGVRISGGGYRMGQFDQDAYTVTSPISLSNSRGKNSEKGSISIDGRFRINDDTDFIFEITKTNVERNEGIISEIGQVGYEFNSYKSNIKHTSDYGLWDFLVYRNNVYVPDVRQNYNQVTVAQLSNVFKAGINHTFRLMGEYRDNRASTLFSTNDPQIQFDVLTTSALWSWRVNQNITFSNTLRHDSLQFDYKGSSIRGAKYQESDFDNRSIDEFSINSGLIYKATEYDTIRLSFARGVDLPSHVEVSFDSGIFQGNPNLKVSTIYSYEVGYEHLLTEYDTRFKSAIFHQIILDPQVSGGLNFIDPAYFNGGKTKSSGIELGLYGEYKDFDWSLNYTYVSVTDHNNARSLSSLMAPLGGAVYFEESYPKNTINCTLGYTNDKWEIDSFFNYYSNYSIISNANSAAKHDIGSAITISARIAYNWNDNLAFSLSGKNLNGNHDQAATREVEPQVFLNTTYRF